MAVGRDRRPGDGREDRASDQRHDRQAPRHPANDRVDGIDRFMARPA
jgi:hypothetical protein